MQNWDLADDLFRSTYVVIARNPEGVTWQSQGSWFYIGSSLRLPRLLVKPRNDTVGGAMRSSYFHLIQHSALSILHF